MPYTTKKLKSGKVQVRSPHGIKSKGSTPENAKKQIRLLHAVEHGYEPTGNKHEKMKKRVLGK